MEDARVSEHCLRGQTEKELGESLVMDWGTQGQSWIEWAAEYELRDQMLDCDSENDWGEGKAKDRWGQRSDSELEKQVG